MSNPLENWTEEQRAVLLYRVCAEAEAGTPRAELFRRLAGEAEAQAAIWGAQVTARGNPPPGPYAPDRRTLPVAVDVTAIALFAVGALLSLFTGRGALRSGARMLALGGLAGAVTFAVGRLAGVALG